MTKRYVLHLFLLLAFLSVLTIKDGFCKKYYKSAAARRAILAERWQRYTRWERLKKLEMLELKRARAAKELERPGEEEPIEGEVEIQRVELIGITKEGLWLRFAKKGDVFLRKQHVLFEGEVPTEGLGVGPAEFITPEEFKPEELRKDIEALEKGLAGELLVRLEGVVGGGQSVILLEEPKEFKAGEVVENPLVQNFKSSLEMADFSDQVLEINLRGVLATEEKLKETSDDSEYDLILKYDFGPDINDFIKPYSSIEAEPSTSLDYIPYPEVKDEVRALMKLNEFAVFILKMILFKKRVEEKDLPAAIGYWFAKLAAAKEFNSFDEIFEELPSTIRELADSVFIGESSLPDFLREQYEAYKVVEQASFEIDPENIGEMDEEQVASTVGGIIFKTLNDWQAAREKFRQSDPVKYKSLIEEPQRQLLAAQTMLEMGRSTSGRKKVFSKKAEAVRLATQRAKERKKEFRQLILDYEFESGQTVMKFLEESLLWLRATAQDFDRVREWLLPLEQIGVDVKSLLSRVENLAEAELRKVVAGA